MPTPKSAWVPLDMSPKMDNAEYGAGDAVQVTVPVSFNGIVQEAWVAVGVEFPSATLQLHKFTGKTSSQNLLPIVSAGIDSTVISANLASKLTVVSNTETRRLRAGQVLKAIWTFTTPGAGDAPSCIVWVEPTEW